jgi:hypothetical protein
LHDQQRNSDLGTESRQLTHTRGNKRGRGRMPQRIDEYMVIVFIVIAIGIGLFFTVIILPE